MQEGTDRSILQSEFLAAIIHDIDIVYPLCLTSKHVANSMCEHIEGGGAMASLVLDTATKAAQRKASAKSYAAKLSFLLRKVPQSGPIPNSVLHVPHIPAAVVRAVIRAGQWLTYAQLLSAAQATVPGFEVWMQVYRQLGIERPSGMHPAAEALCCGGEVGGRLQGEAGWEVTADDLPDLLRFAVALPRTSAATNGLIALCQLPVAQNLSIELCSEFLRVMIKLGASERIEKFLKLPAAQQLPQGSIISLLASAVEAKLAYTVRLLCAMPSATQINAIDVQGFLQSAAQIEVAFGRLVNPDIAQGKEKLPIPVWNSIDDDDSIIVVVPGPDGFSHEFTYIADYKIGNEAAKIMAMEAEHKFKSECGSECGIQYGGGGDKKFVNYTAEGLLMCTQPCGVKECDPGNEDCGFKQCKSNNIIMSGLRHPLEIFKVSKQKRWGVRCSVDLPAGALICPYIGRVIHNHIADQFHQQNLYLFNLNHFHQLADAEDADKLPVLMNPRMPQLPKDYRKKHLVIDAYRHGNVGRFINHSCQPNCLVQTVFSGYARSYLLYHVVIVASEDIPAFTEITYDYFYSRGGGRVPDAQNPGLNNTLRINCICGAPNCNGRLI